VRVPGYLHRPASPSGDALVLAHGAGSDHRAPLLAAVAEAFAAVGWFVLRFDLPFRQARPHGPPFPGEAARDREGLRRAVEAVTEHAPGRIVLGGHSYGGRQASMLAAEDPALAAALLLLSYPLHPPRRPAEQRTAHFTSLRTPALFVHGSRDPFGSLEELRAALKMIPALNAVVEVPGAGHDLKRGAGGLAARVVEALAALTRGNAG
jgi:predicted alpha/beta-hydrolase family hydrolase